MHTHINRHNTGYEVVLANTAASQKIHFNLRYQIYCIEKGFEEAKQFPDGLEKDEYDDRAVHFLIKHKADHQWVGTFRLIIDKFHDLPISQHAHIAHAHQADPQKAVVEFSRLGILRPFQKHSQKIARDSEDPDLCIVFNAISAGIEYSRKCGSHKIYFLCRRSLIRVVNKMGIKTHQVGDKTVYRGTRYPYKLDLADFPLRLFETRHALQEFHRKNSYHHYCQASAFEERQPVKAAA